MTNEINKLNTKKAGTFMNIPVKILKDAVDIVAQPLTDIWKREVVGRRKFSSQLKLADITPIHKKLETIKKENYRPVSQIGSRRLPRRRRDNSTCFVCRPTWYNY